MASIWGELKRRNVVRVALAYAAVSWLVLQLAEILIPMLGLPESVGKLVFFFLAIGFPLALVLAWAYELTPEGLKREHKVDRSRSMASQTGRRIDFLIIAVLVVAVGTLLLDRFFLHDAAEVATVVADDLATTEPSLAVSQTDSLDQNGVLPNSVAVLPFDNLSLNSDDAFFAIGIHDAILSRLSKVSDLSVIARSSVMPYADTDLPLSEIAKQLNVGSIMIGTVRYADDSVRITAQLVDVQTGAQLWSEPYTRPFENIFEIETEIATAIALALEAQLLPDELEQLGREPTDSPEAYEYYLRARTLLPNIGSGDVPEDFHVFLNRAIELDPNFALAYAAKASDLAFAMRRDETGLYKSSTLPDREAMANGYAQKALSIDPNLGLGHMALGLIHRFNRRGLKAVESFEHASQLSPNDSDILDDYSRVLSEMGRYDEAISIARRAADLRPGTWTGLAEIYWRAGDYDAAADGFRRIIENGGSSLRVHSTLAMTEFMRGNFDEVRIQLALHEALDSTWSRGTHRIYLYGRIGDKETAKLLFDDWSKETINTQTARARNALAYLAIGDNAAALDWLQQLSENKTPYNWGSDENDIAMNIYADPVLEQPEFVEVRRNLGFRDQ